MCTAVRAVDQVTASLVCVRELGSYDVGVVCDDAAPAPACRAGLCAGGRCFYPCATDSDCRPGRCGTVPMIVEGVTLDESTCLP